MSPILLVVALCYEDRIVAVFRRITETPPKMKVIEQALQARRSQSKESKLAVAYFSGVKNGDGRGFARALHAAQPMNFSEATLEAVPVAIRHFALLGDLRPMRAVFSWAWDGAPAELIGDAYAWGASNREAAFVDAYRTLSLKTKRGVARLIGTEVNRELASGKLALAQRQKRFAASSLWKMILTYTE